MAIEQHGGPGLMDIVLANDRLDVELAAMPPGVGELVHPSGVLGARLVTADLIDVEHPWRHDSRKLAQTLVDLYNQASK